MTAAMPCRLFYAIPTYKNILRQNMEIITCWSIRRMSATMPALAIEWPPPNATIAGENAVLVLGLRHVHVRPEAAMWMGGHWHAYATVANQEVEICFKLERLDEEDSPHAWGAWGGARGEELGTLSPDDTGSQPFGTRVIGEA